MDKRTDHPNAQRRRLMKAFAAAPLLAASTVAGAPWRETRSVERLVVLAAPDTSSARAIGRAYLSLARTEADIHRLVKAVLDRMKIAPADLHRISNITLQSLFDRAVRQDFSQHDTVQLDGWVLSRTEVRLCALAAMVG